MIRKSWYYSNAVPLYFQTQVRLPDDHIGDSRIDGVSMNSEKTYIVQPVNFPDPVKYMKFKNSGNRLVTWVPEVNLEPFEWHVL